MTRPNSKFTAFALTLPNDATLTGHVYVPERSNARAAHVPLIVFLHGGGCHSGYIDVSDDCTASTTAEALQIPVVSVNRPCYKGTSSIYPLPENSSFHKETGLWEHEYIFPAIWETFGLPNGCSAIVAMSHSLGTPGLLVAAALHARNENPAYPLAGSIMSGWGCRRALDSQKTWPSMSPEQRRAIRDIMMLSDPRLRAADEGMRSHVTAQTVESPVEEIEECVSGPWSRYFPDFAAQITIPIMFAIGEHDWLWEGTQAHVREFSSFFQRCPRFDGSIVEGAPHAIEWSYYANGWYARCFGFAMEVAAYSIVGMPSGRI